MQVDRQRLHRALNPRTVAIVGDKGPNYTWLTNLSEYAGTLVSVQLDPKEIPGIEQRGVTNYSSLLDVPHEVDLVICAVPRNVAPFIVADAVKKQVGGVSMFTSGFAETGEPQAIELQAKIVASATAANLPLIGPNCMGVYNRRLGVKFNAGQEFGEGGDISIVSQSGSHGRVMTASAQGLGIRVTRTISIGNAAVLNECDYLEYLAGDEDTPAIAMYLEGVRDGRRFFALLREATKRKPVLILRGGRSRAGARAVHSHTGSLASDDAIWSALLRQAGAVSVDTIEEMADAMAALVHAPRPTGRGLALVAMTGGQSVAISDQFERAGFDVPVLSDQSYARLSEFFNTVGGSYRNPFDAASTIGRETDNLAKILEIVEQDPAIDGGVAIELGLRGLDEGMDSLDEVLALLRQYRDRSGRPVIALTPTDGAMGENEELTVRARHHIALRGFPVYPSFQRGAQALGRIAAYWSERAERTGA